MTQPTRSLRLQKRSTRSLNTLSGSVGEIFYDSETRALRLYTENQGTSVTIADRTWVVNNTFDGNYNNLINLPAIPDITGLASESFVTAAVSGLITIDDVGTGGIQGNIPDNTWAILSMVSEGNEVSFYLNGELMYAQAGMPIMQSENNPLYLGHRYQGDNIQGSINIAEALVYNSALSQSDRYGIECYLMSKYGIS